MQVIHHLTNRCALSFRKIKITDILTAAAPPFNPWAWDSHFSWHFHPTSNPQRAPGDLTGSPSATSSASSIKFMFDHVNQRAAVAAGEALNKQALSYVNRQERRAETEDSCNQRAGTWLSCITANIWWVPLVQPRCENVKD